jgi:hypothetical protein
MCKGHHKIRVQLHIQAQGDLPLAVAKTDASVEELVGAYFIEFPDELPGMVVDDLAALFELVQFFKDRDRDDNIVFVETIDTGTVVQDNVGVENKDFFILWHVPPGMAEIGL